MESKDRSSNENLGRSQSMQDLKTKRGQHGCLAQFRDDTATSRKGTSSYPSSPRTRANRDHGVSDIDKMLRKKLDIVSSVLNVPNEDAIISTDSGLGSPRSPFVNRTLLDGDLSAIDLSPLDFNQFSTTGRNGEHFPENDDDATNEDEEEEEFQNVDEIDGPVLSVNNQTNENGGDDEVIDYNMPVNDAYRKSLEECAEKITNECGFKPSLQPRFEWYLEDSLNTQNELEDWFCFSDYSYFTPMHDAFIHYVKDTKKFISDDIYAQMIIKQLINGLNEDCENSLKCLCYISLGSFGHVEGKEEHEKTIRRNNTLLMEYLSTIVKYFIRIANDCRDKNDQLIKLTRMLFFSCSIIYFVVLLCISLRNKKEKKVLVRNAINNLTESKILTYLTKYIEHWRWNSRLSMRIRNIIMLLSKCLVLQFGDIKTYKNSKKSLYRYHKISSNPDKKNKLTVSPLHYEAFSLDISSRYPSYELPKSQLPLDSDKSNSLSQFLEIPRPKAKNPVNATLNMPEQHLATPAPSPPSSPKLMHFNETPKTRKSFQTNLLYPCLYPSDDDEENDELEERMRLGSEFHQDNDITIPYSIEEAAKILSENLEIKLSTKQLWHERDLFMITERGWEDDNMKDPYDYHDVTDEVDQDLFEILTRVDDYYREALPCLNSLVFVLLQTIELNLTNQFILTTDPVDDGAIKAQLEVLKAKEKSMKSSIEILFFLLKWFKLSHILKFEHLAVILYDSQFINISSAILGKYSDHYADRIFNRAVISQKNFWLEASKYNFEYKNSFRYMNQVQKPVEVDLIPVFAYMLRTLRKVVGTKTQRIKELPQSIGTILKKYYHIFNLDIYHPILKIIKELTPFKNKRWKSEHMELISGVFLYEQLELVDNWVTGKDISGELSDAYGQEIALRALLQFYNFTHYQLAMEDLGYVKKKNGFYPE
ncbi:Factor arrest protein 11 [Nakaseomyces bracarensis]|uniref:Factor arrest protein 11 n=1 Tax=Nakaseomyces bracarensis TaxID=273131 RepID=A0ABR4NUR7_9SACH